MWLQVESAKAGAGKATGSREEQDELELPNLRKHARGGGLPLLGQVCPSRYFITLMFLCIGQLTGLQRQLYDVGTTTTLAQTLQACPQ